jgi:23S rRNA (adenine2030-N6)-methyltransferase
MLSYQHKYHAANLADVHKHAVLAVLLEYLTRKPKPVTYVETHAGRALYNLSDTAAQKNWRGQRGTVSY